MKTTFYQKSVSFNFGEEGDINYLRITLRLPVLKYKKIDSYTYEPEEKTEISLDTDLGFHKSEVHYCFFFALFGFGLFITRQDGY